MRIPPKRIALMLLRRYFFDIIRLFQYLPICRNRKIFKNGKQLHYGSGAKSGSVNSLRYASGTEKYPESF